jgi:hypothetical protein
MSRNYLLPYGERCAAKRVPFVLPVSPLFANSRNNQFQMVRHHPIRKGKVDLLVSWNFKHIVNVYRIRGYNSVNLKLGYQTLNIHSPKEIVGYESED